MTAPEPILSLSNFPDVVHQHATPKCAPTPITTVTIPLRRRKTGSAFRPATGVRTPRTVAPRPCSTLQVICRLLKSHR